MMQIKIFFICLSLEHNVYSGTDHIDNNITKNCLHYGELDNGNDKSISSIPQFICTLRALTQSTELGRQAKVNVDNATRLQWKDWQFANDTAYVFIVVLDADALAKPPKISFT